LYPVILIYGAARRKQGGSQSLNDNAKGPAKSAGALLRRYGEQALRDVEICDFFQRICIDFLIRIFAACFSIGLRISMHVNEFGFVPAPQIAEYSSTLRDS